MTTQGERITAVEVEVSHLRQEVSDLRAELKNSNERFEKEMLKAGEKLDKLLALQHKGVGAFWLASSIVGTGIIGALWSFVGWVK